MAAAHGQCYVCFGLCGSICLIYIAIALRQQLKLTKEYQKQTKHNAPQKYPKYIKRDINLLRTTKFAFPQNYWLSIVNILKRKARVWGTVFKLTHHGETKYEWNHFVIIVRQKKLGKGYFGIIAKKCLWHVFIRVSWSARRNKWTDHMQQGQQWTKKEDLKLER